MVGPLSHHFINVHFFTTFIYIYRSNLKNIFGFWDIPTIGRRFYRGSPGTENYEYGNILRTIISTRALVLVCRLHYRTLTSNTDREKWLDRKDPLWSAVQHSGEFVDTPLKMHLSLTPEGDSWSGHSSITESVVTVFFV